MKTIELYIEDKKVDTYGEEGFTLTFTIAEISEIGKKSSSFSKEITLPANDNNNRVFTSLFDVTVDGGFNPISRKRAVLYVDGVALMQGYFKLNGINIKDSEYVTYKGVLYEEQTNFINAIEGFNLDNLVIPVTGSTQVIKAPYTQVSIYNITGTTAAFIAQINGTNLYKGLQFGGLSFPLTTYGVAATKPRTTSLPSGAVWNPTTVMSYKATSNQFNQINVSLTVSNTPSAANTSYRYAVIKSDYNTPISGAFTDYVIFNGEANFTRGIGIINFSCRMPLLTNDEYRIEIYERTGANFTLSSATLNGQVFTGTLETISGETINTTNIVKTTQNVNNSDQGVIVYPLVDYGEQYRFLNINFGNFFQIRNTMYVNADVMRPSVFVKHVWDAIFEQAGFTYTSQFLNSPDFKKMVIAGGVNDDDLSALVYSSYYNTARPNNIMFTSVTNDTQLLNSNNQVTEYFYNHQHMSNATPDILANTSKYFINDILYDPYFTHIASKKFTNVKAHTVEYDRNGALRFYYGYNLPYPDDHGVFPTAAADGKYRVHAKLSFTSHAGYDVANPAILYDYETSHIIQIQKLRIGSYKYFPTSSTAPEYDKWEVIKQSKPFKRQKNLLDQPAVLELNEVLNLNKGDMIRVIIIADANREFNAPTNPSFNKIVNYITIQPGQTDTFLKFYRNGIVNGGTITNAATLLPRSFKQKDFILEIAKMFNLYFEVDKENPRSIYIEPRDAYYESGRILNYERKIDYSKEFNISILSHDYARNQIFKYKNDSKDYYSTEYGKKSANELIFGSYNFQSLNEYNFDETKLELKFAPSYSQQIGDPRLKITRIHDPKIHDVESTVTTKPNYKIEPRIMFYKKVDLNFDDYKIILTSTAANTNYTPLVNGIDNSSLQPKTFTMLNYGYAGHLNDPNTPTFDLNWFTDYNYLPGTTATSNNLFNIFYKNEMIELTDQSARKVECFVDLQPYDIVNLRFNDVYYFKKDYWRLIEIKDYNTSSDINQTTKCTFIKIVRAQTNQLIDYGAFGYGGLAGGTAGGLTGTPLDQSPKISIGGGTDVVDVINWDTVEKINVDKNKLNYDVTLVDTPIFMPLDEYMVPIIETHTADISQVKDITISIQDNVNQIGGGEVIYLTDAEYPAGSVVELTSTQKRMLVQTTYPYELGGYVEIKLPQVNDDLYDGYSFEILADTGKGATLTINYLDENDNVVDLYTPDDALEIDGISDSSIKSIKLTYWAGSGKYLQTQTCVC
jgi:hypothetical protein